MYSRLRTELSSSQISYWTLWLLLSCNPNGIRRWRGWPPHKIEGFNCYNYKIVYLEIERALEKFAHAYHALHLIDYWLARSWAYWNVFNESPSTCLELNPILGYWLAVIILCWSPLYFYYDEFKSGNNRIQLIRNSRCNRFWCLRV